MFNKKIIALALTLTLSTTMVACNKNKDIKNKENSKTSTVEAQQEFEAKQIPIEATDLKTKKKVGKEILTKDVNIVFIWQPSSQPSQIEASLLEGIYKDYKNVEFIGLGIAEDEKTLNQAALDWGMTFKTYLATEKFVKDVSGYITSTPTILILDKNGKEIALMKVGSSNDQTNIDAQKEELKTQIESYTNEK